MQRRTRGRGVTKILRVGVLSALGLFPPTSGVVEAQEPTVDPRPSWALTGGVGNVRGWLGLNGEIFFAGGRWSGVAGAGYVWETDAVVEAFSAFGAGIRRYFGSPRHQGFGELSYTLVVVEQRGVISGPMESDRLYGPGLGGGYRFTSGGGLHLELGLGIGWSPENDTVAPTGSIGIGYTRRQE